MSANPLLIKNVHLMDGVSTDMFGWLLCENGIIQNFGIEQPPNMIESAHCQVIDGGGLLLTPGFLDIHVHGALGAEAMDADPSLLKQMGRFYARHGVTGFLPTTWAAGIDDLLPVLQMARQEMDQHHEGAAILGVHLEGPFINPAMAGAQNPEFIYAPHAERLKELLDLNVIRLITLAPEIPENDWLIHECVRRGITVSAGHTNADFDAMVAAVEKGVSQVTHTFNAMKGLHHREPGTVGASLTLDALSCELIADTIHVHPAVMKLVYRAKGSEKVILVTDAMRGTGLPDGEYPVDNRIITIHHGAARLPGGQLAGSTLTMETALRNMIDATGTSMKEILPMVTINPARSMKLANRKGSLAVGKDADLVLLDESIQVRMTIINGRISHSN
ncbi:MAG: N-acetylglucosamine-6-phosphate deacetylase [Anaerolineae bacterium]|nr:N-acetylglucosamine-6-phosphate deacetylase [Anaerolineae bacterium]